MNRRVWSRAFYCALTLWTSLFLSESEWLVRCPAHGGSHAEVAGSTSSGRSAPGSARTATDHSNHASANHSSAPSDEEGAGHPCACPGPGCCPPAVAAVPHQDLPLAHVVAVHAAAAVSALDVFAESSDYLHPPATAPPTAGLAPLT